MFAKKSLGQNFLKSKSVLAAIVAAGNIVESDIVLEIGPGKGALTSALLQTKAYVVAIEKDDRLIPVLEEMFRGEIASGKLSLVHGDIAEISTATLTKGKPFKVIANIPYYITGLLFRKFLEVGPQPGCMVLLVQKEVGQRIVARDGKESIMSLSVKAYGVPKIVEKVSRKMFNPQPSVDSVVISLSEISKNFFDSFTEKTFFAWIHAGFAQKRKKLIRNLEAVVEKEKLENVFATLGWDENIRAEDITLSDWKKILTEFSLPG